MVPPKFGPGRYGCCGKRKPAGERYSYCPDCKAAYSRVWRTAHHRRGDPGYERHLVKCRAVGKARTRERIEDRRWRLRRVQIALAAMKKAGMTGMEIARRLGVHEESVYAWRRGTRCPRPSYAARVVRLADELAMAS